MFEILIDDFRKTYQDVAFTGKFACNGVQVAVETFMPSKSVEINTSKLLLGESTSR